MNQMINATLKQSTQPEKVATIFVVDDELSVRESMAMYFEDVYEVVTCESGEECLELIKEHDVDIVLLDLRMDGMSGEDALQRIKEYDPTICVIIVSAYVDIQCAVHCMKFGAYDVVTKPPDLIHLEGIFRNVLSERGLSREVAILREELQQFRRYNNLISASSKMNEVMERANKVSYLETDCLLIGETGTGKELIADYIHTTGVRSDKPFIIVDCASITKTLATSILFGHEKGAFTGAFNKKIGKFELAQGGIIFLDEIAHLPKEIQPFLLRALENRTIQRVGGANNVELNIQIIAATNRDMKNLVEKGDFISDLYYRLMTVPIDIPPLRDRPEDIKPLAMHFINLHRKKYDCNMAGIDEDALELMQSYSWPGNVRELRYAVEHIMVIHGSESSLSINHLPNELVDQDFKVKYTTNHSDLSKAIQEIEIFYIRRALEQNKGNISQAAKELDMGRNTLYRKMKNYNIDL